ncbi:LacI family transcriptional regulator [Rhizomicrobium palustre]|uniref:LacI family transcriptional regulator n=2 Tax=Rhizomicrobium palustre TaxID=189966 RepID=A0A846N614_9PROT|nr:LacI family transcriptional regulator [Rhizomicrobium palustre]
MTVSRVVNGESNVREATRDAVQKAMRELQFRPNKAARSLAGAQEIRIGLLYNNPSVAYFTALLLGALDGSSRNAAQLVVDKSEVGDAVAATQAVRTLIKGGINGILLTAPLSERSDLIAELKEQEVSIVGMATSSFTGEITCVGIDDFKAGYDLTKYLIGLGHSRIAFISGHPSHSSSRQRRAGFEAAIKEAGAKVEKPRVAQGDYSYRSGMEAAEELLSGKTAPTAIFASNDDMASGAMSVAHRKGLEVPKDLSVVGFDDTIASSLWPALTTIRQPVGEIAATAINLIAQEVRDRRNDRPVEIQNITVPHLLVERESAVPPRKR